MRHTDVGANRASKSTRLSPAMTLAMDIGAVVVAISLALTMSYGITFWGWK